MKQLKQSKTILSRRHKQALYLCATVLWISGAVWISLSESNPARPLWMRLHGAAAMIFLVIFGTLLTQHVPAGWQQKSQRPSGLSIISACVILILTGWGLYYMADENVRNGLHWVHTSVGLILPGIIFLHVWMSKRSKI